MAEQGKNAEGEVIRDTQVGTEGDDVPDRLQLQGETGREPRPYEGEGTHRFETRMSDEEIQRGLGRDARRAAEVMHVHPQQQQPQPQPQQQAEVETQAKARGDRVQRPSEEEAKEKALSPQITPRGSQQL